MVSRRVKLRLLQFTALSAGLAVGLVGQNLEGEKIIALAKSSHAQVEGESAIESASGVVARGIHAAATLPYDLFDRVTQTTPSEAPTEEAATLASLEPERETFSLGLDRIDWMALGNRRLVDDPEESADSSDSLRTKMAALKTLPSPSHFSRTNAPVFHKAPTPETTEADTTGAHVARADPPPLIRTFGELMPSIGAPTPVAKAPPVAVPAEDQTKVSALHVSPPPVERPGPIPARTVEAPSDAVLPRLPETSSVFSVEAKGPTPPEVPAHCDIKAETPAAVVAGDKVALRFFEVAATASASSRDTGTAVGFERLEMGGTFEVSEDGSVSLPLLGRIDVRGQELPCIEARVARLYAETTKSDVTINASFMARPPVMVRGAVRAPGAYQFTPGMTVEAVMALAGTQGDNSVDPQLLASLSAREAEIERLALGKLLAHKRLSAAFDGVDSIEMSASERAHMTEVLGEHRIESELRALSTSLASAAAHEADLRAKIGSYDIQIAAYEDSLKLLESQLASQTARLEKLRATHERGADPMNRVTASETARPGKLLNLHDREVVPVDQIEEAEMALMPLVRQRLEVVTELVSLRSARDAVARSITITDAARREELAALMRDNAEDINALAAQRANVGTQLAALRNNVPASNLFAYSIERPGEPGGPIVADISTRLRPGDIATITVLDPSSATDGRFGQADLQGGARVAPKATQ
jgi:protein involved in polysaccharide export with SLBB domain